MTSKAIESLVTVSSLCSELGKLGVQRGMVLICHSSLKSLGWVCGGPVALIQALEETLGENGLLVMPTHSNDLSEPRFWQNPPVLEVLWQSIRDEMPPFMHDLTPVFEMGVIAECFRKQQGVSRSSHPQFSFAAWGRGSASVTADHGLSMSLGEASPLRDIYDRDGWVLLLGVDHDCNTSLHLAESRARYKGRRIVQQGAPILVDGERRWVSFEDLDVDNQDFLALGAEFARDTGLVRVGKIGAACSMLMPQRALVDYAVGWIERHRGGE